MNNATPTSTPIPTLVATNAPKASGMTHVVEYGDPSDMPEMQWFWRRIFIYAVTFGASYELDKLSSRIHSEPLLHDIVRLMCAVVMLAMMLYVAGASSEAITKLVGAIKTSRKETVSTADVVTTNNSHDGVSTAQATTSPAPAASVTSTLEATDVGTPDTNEPTTGSTPRNDGADSQPSGTSSESSGDDPTDPTDPVLRRPAV